ncbi:MAG TPA: hypothetical protein VFS20_33905 [Longimicrobium sp.]|nr:hypothetical protein [Longimicrobium sp.]
MADPQGLSERRHDTDAGGHPKAFTLREVGRKNDLRLDVDLGEARSSHL